MKQKYIFIDRDGTLIIEPADKQIDSLEKVKLLPDVIPSLLRLKNAGYRLVMITNQDGLGTESFPQESFYKPHHFLLTLLKSQGIFFDAVKICPHKLQENCYCRKPAAGLLLEYFMNDRIDKDNSYVIGDRDTDLQLANTLNIKSWQVNQNEVDSWIKITQAILSSPRIAEIKRQTKETVIQCTVNLDDSCGREINTGIAFFDHMLEQLSQHAGFSLMISVKGDLHIDDHHTVEDVGIVLGEALRKALGEKRGIARYGFLLPMDDALAHIALDLCNRAFLHFEGKFHRDNIGSFSTEMVQHFFNSFSTSLACVLHIKVSGNNTHHMIEAVFKGVGRCLKQAIQIIDKEIPTTKGLL